MTEGNTVQEWLDMENPWEKTKSSEYMIDPFRKSVANLSNKLATGVVQGTASNINKIRSGLLNIGLPKSDVEKTGQGIGRVHSETQYSLPELTRWGQGGNKKALQLHNMLQNKAMKGKSIGNVGGRSLYSIPSFNSN